MSYIPTEWFTGDVITAEKLNKIEDGIADIEGGVTIVTQNVDTLSSNVNGQLTYVNSSLTDQRERLYYLEGMLTASGGSHGDEGADLVRILAFDPSRDGDNYIWISLQELVNILPSASSE